MRNLLIFGVIIVLSIIILTGFIGTTGNRASYLLQENQDNYDVVFYHLDLNVSDTSTYISGSATILIRPLVASPDFAVFNFSGNLTTDSVKVAGRLAEYTHESDRLSVSLENRPGEDGLVSVQVFYHGLGSNYKNLEGIYNRYVASWDKHVTWTLSEPFSAYNFFPCKQSLTDKADSVYIFLSTDKTLKAGSNGILTAEIPLPDNRVRYEWKSRHPIAYYLISFCVSDYLDYSFYVRIDDGADSILIQNYIYNDSNYFKQNKSNIDKTGDLMLLYSGLWGRYPFSNEKYGHCTAPFGGGMEHQTMTTLINFSFLLVAHELAHQWFGDYVTCATWQDIWINEGFASYAEYLAYEYLGTETEAYYWITGCHDYVKSVPDGSVFVPAEFAGNESRIFDSRLSYKKGAAIIHMIRQEVGDDDLFFNILSAFLQKYKNGNATGADFRDYLEEETGRDFSWFFDQWYYGHGYPVHNIRWDHWDDTLFINSLQTGSSQTPLFNVLLEFKVRNNDRDTVISLRQEVNYSQWKIYLPGNVTSLEVDPDRWLLADLYDISKELRPDTGFSVTPVPASDKIRISVSDPVGRYTMYLANSEGKLIYNRESTSGVEELDVNAYPPGLYFVIIKKGKLTLKRKLIIK